MNFYFTESDREARLRDSFVVTLTCPTISTNIFQTGKSKRTKRIFYDAAAPEPDDEDVELVFYCFVRPACRQIQLGGVALEKRATAPATCELACFTLEPNDLNLKRK